jgi:hypothetical protein
MGRTWSHDSGQGLRLVLPQRLPDSAAAERSSPWIEGAGGSRCDALMAPLCF